MADSLVVGGQIELLGADGGVPSDLEACLGAVFTLADGYDLSAPQTVQDILSLSLTDGERPTRRRQGNRNITLPVNISAPDRTTLAAAREVLLELCDEDLWTLTWTRDGGSPVVFDCFQASAAQPANQLFEEQENVYRLILTFPALPFGKSDETVPFLFPTPSQVFDQPPTAQVLDIFGTATNFYQGDDAGFEVTQGDWLPGTNCTVTRSTTFGRGSSVASLRLSSVAAGNMNAISADPAALTSSPPTPGAEWMGCNPGDTATGSIWFRAGSVGRSNNIGIDFMDANGTQIGSTLRGSNITSVTTTFTQATTSQTAPAGTVWARLNPQVLATAAGSELHYCDDAIIQRGAVYSADSPQQWSLSNAAPVGAHHSAKWARTWHDNPLYDHILPAPVDITGRDKFTFWAGLATTPSQWSTWHEGAVTYSVTLYDATGNSLRFSRKYRSKASALDGSPHWQWIGLPIPQTQTGFDYTTLTRYSVAAFNVRQNFYGRVLQAGFYLAEVKVTPGTNGAPTTRYGWYDLPAVVGSARSQISLQISPGPSTFSTISEFTTPGNNNFTAPSGLSVVDKSEAWAGGGGGAGSHGSSNGGGGGGGGEYARRDGIAVTALSVYVAKVGSGGGHGGVSQPGNGGGQSFFTGNSQGVTAHGGNGGWQSPTWGGGKGGSGSNDPIHYGGGNGFQANANVRDIGGGGGSAGGPNGGGISATDRPGANNVTGSGPGGNGGFSSNQTPHNGSAPSFGPGGGGGGGNDGGAGFAGGDGRDGKIRLTYGATGLLALSSLLLHMPGRNAPSALSPVVPVGGGSDIPNGGTDYTVPAVGSLAARFDGAYTFYLVAGTWNSPSSSRTITATIKQTPYGGGTVVTTTLVRTVTPNNDITNGYVDMGPVTLPISDLPNGNTSATFSVSVNDTNTSDRFLDGAFLDVTGQTLLVNVPGASALNNIWCDAPDLSRAVGMVYGSNADRDQAYSLTAQIERMSGGAFAVEPGQYNRLLVYSAQGNPGVTGWYTPAWWLDRVDTVVGL